MDAKSAYLASSASEHLVEVRWPEPAVDEPMSWCAEAHGKQKATANCAANTGATLPPADSPCHPIQQLLPLRSMTGPDSLA
mmetsp:Transcript_64468/g.124191  ORF Transcript_64468/g.124191 Transcript_64468/m.124191 type:complete len:81 (+) Transcript_64468:1500-1742(+)